MPAKKPTTVSEYLKSLPDDRRRALEAVRRVIRKNLPKGYAEGIQYGMIGYYVPHSLYPDGYHCDPSQPLPYASLASQKKHMAVYMMGLYGDLRQDAWFRKAWAKATDARLDMGKCCVRFRKLEDLPLDVIGEAIARFPCKDYIERYEANLTPSARKKIESKRGATTTKKTTRKTTKTGAAKKKTVKKSTVRKKTTVRKASTAKKAGTRTSTTKKTSKKATTKRSKRSARGRSS